MTSNQFSDEDEDPISQSVILGGRVRLEYRTPYLLMKKQCTQKERVRLSHGNGKVS